MDSQFGDSMLSTFTALDGDNLAVQDWPLPSGWPKRGMVLLVHGLGEHAGRYQALAAQLNRWGFGVRGYDQYGHGQSGGARGGLSSPRRLVDDLADVVESTRRRMRPESPLIVLGQGLGALVVGCFVAERRAPVEAVVLCSPLLAPRRSVGRRLLLALAQRLDPHASVPAGTDARWLTQHPAAAASRRADRWVHGRISGEMAQFIDQAAGEVAAHAPQWRVPTLLLFAGADRLTQPAATRQWAAALPTQVLTAFEFPGRYHELFNDRDAQPVYEALAGWLDDRF